VQLPSTLSLTLYFPPLYTSYPLSKSLLPLPLYLLPSLSLSFPPSLSTSYPLSHFLLPSHVYLLPSLCLCFPPLSTSYPLSLLPSHVYLLRSSPTLYFPPILSLTLYFPPLSTSPPHSSYPVEFHKLSYFHFNIPIYILIDHYMSYFSYFHVLCRQGRARGRKRERGWRWKGVKGER